MIMKQQNLKKQPHSCHYSKDYRKDILFSSYLHNMCHLSVNDFLAVPEVLVEVLIRNLRREGDRRYRLLYKLVYKFNS